MKKIIIGLIVLFLTAPLISTLEVYAEEDSMEFNITNLDTRTYYSVTDTTSVTKSLTFSPNQTFNYIEKDGKIYLTKYTGSSVYLDIPNTYNNKPVYIGQTICTVQPSGNDNGTFIGPFVNNHDVVLISMDAEPNVENNNADYMFVGCSSLQVGSTINASVTSAIGTYYNCSSLESPGILPFFLKDMTSMYRGCSKLEEMPDIPSTVLTMNSSFRGCSLLPSIRTIPNTVTDLDYAFKGCSKISGDVSLSNSVINAYMTFSDTVDYVILYLNNNSPIINNYYPENVILCTNGGIQWEYYDAGDVVVGTKYVGTNKVVNVPLWIDGKPFRLGDQAFHNNQNIKIVNFQSGALTYNDNPIELFYNCISLVKVNNLPSNLKSFVGGFRHCISLVYPPVIPDGITDMSFIYFGCTSLIEPGVIPPNVTNLYQAYFNTAITYFPEIPNSVTHMYAAFEWCTYLTGTLYIPNSVIYSEELFLNTIESITIEYSKANTYIDNVLLVPNNVTKRPIDDPDWRYSINGTLLTVDKYVGGSDAFVPASLYGYETVYNPFTVFSGNEALRFVTIENGAEVMHGYAHSLFKNCINLESVTGFFSNPFNLDYAFYNCTSLKTVPVLPAHTFYMNYTFAYCEALEVVRELLDMTEADSVFEGCSNLSYIPDNIFSNVREFNRTFYGCSSISGRIVLHDDTTFFNLETVEGVLGDFEIVYSTVNSPVHNLVFPYNITKTLK